MYNLDIFITDCNLLSECRYRDRGPFVSFEQGQWRFRYGCRDQPARILPWWSRPPTSALQVQIYLPCGIGISGAHAYQKLHLVPLTYLSISDLPHLLLWLEVPVPVDLSLGHRWGHNAQDFRVLEPTYGKCWKGARCQQEGICLLWRCLLLGHHTNRNVESDNNGPWKKKQINANYFG